MPRSIVVLALSLLVTGACGVSVVESPSATAGSTVPPAATATPLETPIPEATPNPGPTPTPALSCPPTPTTATEVVAMSVPTAAACYGDTPLTIEGYSVLCTGCGGVDEYDRTPSWLALAVPMYSVGATVPAPGQEASTSFPVFIDPATGLTFPAAGSLVRVTGHFNDPIAETCRATPKPGSSVSALDPKSVITACRASFVVTAVSEVTP